MSELDPMEVHDRQVLAVQNAVAKILPRMAEKGFTPEAIFEGALKGGAVTLLAGTTATPKEVARMMNEIAEAIEEIDHRVDLQ